VACVGEKRNEYRGFGGGGGEKQKAHVKDPAGEGGKIFKRIFHG